MEKINILGVPFDSCTLGEAVEFCRGLLAEEGCKAIHTPNSEIVRLCIKQPEYYDIINDAALIIPDGAGVVLASKILGTPLKKGKVAGVDLMGRLITLSAETGVPVFLLGGKPGVADTASENLKKANPGLIIAGTRDGYFKDDEEVVRQINESGARLLCVCMGVPRQESWVKKNKAKFESVTLAGCFGGSIDVYAGTAKRAPQWFIDHHLEWFYRLMKQPSRIGRMMALPAFILNAVGYRLKHGKPKK